MQNHYNSLNYYYKKTYIAKSLKQPYTFMLNYEISTLR